MEIFKPIHHVSPRGIWTTKLSLRASSIIFSIALAGVAGSIANGALNSYWPLIVLAAPILISIGWSFAEGICIVTRPGRRGIHPGACVGVDLVLWLGWIICTVFLAMSGVEGGHESIYEYGFPYSSYDDPKYLDDFAKLLARGRAVVALCALLLATHFTLFVIACYETNQRNHERMVTYIMHPIQPYGAPGVVAPAQSHHAPRPVAGQH